MTEWQIAKEWGVSLDRWNLIHPIRRAEMIATILHTRERECYEQDNAPKDGKKPKNSGYDTMMSGMNFK